MKYSQHIIMYHILGAFDIGGGVGGLILRGGDLTRKWFECRMVMGVTAMRPRVRAAGVAPTPASIRERTHHNLGCCSLLPRALRTPYTQPIYSQPQALNLGHFRQFMNGPGLAWLDGANVVWRVSQRRII